MALRVRRKISNLPHFRDQWSQEKRVQERIGARARESGSGEGQSRWRSQARKATPSLLLTHCEAVQFNYVRMMFPESAKLNPDPYFAEISLFAFVRSSSRVGLRPGLICRASAKSCSASSVFFKRIRARPR